MVSKAEVGTAVAIWVTQAMVSKLQGNRTLSGICDAVTARNAVCEAVFTQFSPLVPPDSDLACREGCGHCCKAVIQTRPLEAIFAAAHAQLTLSAENLQEIRQRVAQQRLPCPFLSDESCSIYTARLNVCRQYYSPALSDCLNGVYCQRNLKPEDNQTIRHQSHLREVVYTAAVQGEDEACRLLNLQNGSMVLDNVLRVLYSQPSVVERWLSGEQVFEPIRTS